MCVNVPLLTHCRSWSGLWHHNTPGWDLHPGRRAASTGRNHPDLKTHTHTRLHLTMHLIICVCDVFFIDFPVINILFAFFLSITKGITVLLHTHHHHHQHVTELCVWALHLKTVWMVKTTSCLTLPVPQKHQCSYTCRR